MDEALEDWFCREILPHEAALTRYLTRARANAADIQDMRQEVYIRVMEAARKTLPATPRFFLFHVARMFLSDQARKKRIVPIDLLQEAATPNGLIDEVSPERSAGGFQQLVRLVGAFEQLPDRCREVVWLRKIDDMPQREIAQRLQVAEGTVEAHLVRGMRLLTRHFHGETGAVPGATPAGAGLESSKGPGKGPGSGSGNGSGNGY